MLNLLTIANFDIFANSNFFLAMFDQCLTILRAYDYMIDWIIKATNAFMKNQPSVHSPHCHKHIAAGAVV